MYLAGNTSRSIFAGLSSPQDQNGSSCSQRACCERYAPSAALEKTSKAPYMVAGMYFAQFKKKTSLRCEPRVAQVALSTSGCPTCHCRCPRKRSA